MLRITAARLRHEMTNPERQSLRDNLKLRGQFCALAETCELKCLRQAGVIRFRYVSVSIPCAQHPEL